MTSLRSALVEAGLVANLEKFEENFIEGDSDLSPIKRRLIIRRLLSERNDANLQGTASDHRQGCQRRRA